MLDRLRIPKFPWVPQVSPRLRDMGTTTLFLLLPFVEGKNPETAE